MIQQKIVLHLAGVSCSGKSTQAELLAEKIPNVYTVSSDKLKWGIQGYDRTVHVPLVKKITAGLFEVICKQELTILLMAFISTEEDYRAYKTIADQYGYSFISVKFTAPEDVLLSRFRKRIANVKEAGKTISVMDEEIFLENLKKDYFTPAETMVYDTSTQTPQEITDAILESIKL